MKIVEEYTNWGVIFDYLCDECSFSLHRYDVDSSTFYLSSVHVKPEFREQGIGNSILDKAEKDVIEFYKADTLALKCHKESWMHKWYERHGYKDMCEDEWNDNFVWMYKNLK